MTEDRLMVAQAVFNGQIGEEYLSTDEIDEFCFLVAEVAMDKEMAEASKRGCNVFTGFEYDLTH